MEKGQFRLPSIWVFSITTIFILFAGRANGQADSLNCTLLGKLGFSWGLAGVWGYTDTIGNEYALVGTEDGMGIVNVTNPANPTLALHIPSAYSLWREIKTWKNYAYVVHDFTYSWNTVPMQGVQIVNLDSLTTPTVKAFRPTFALGPNQDSLTRAHTLWIDENGILYLFGSNIYSGVMMFDIATDPWNPQFLGSFNNFYMHDGFVRDNILYASAILNGFVAVIDVTLKSNPQLLKTFQTPSLFTHNAWLSDDDNTLFTTDEVSGAFVAAYDISDLNNITEQDRIRSLPGTGVIPHNVQVYGDHLVTSYYTRGVQIVDAKYPDLLIEVGFYDTSPNFSGDGFKGAWGAYPYLPSGNILVSDMQEGLHIVHTDYPYGSRVYGIVKDSLTGNTLFGADVALAINNYVAKSAIDGTFKAGFLYTGWDTLNVSLAGYYDAEVAINFTAGQYDTVIVALLPLNFSVDENQQKNFVVYPNPNDGRFTIKLNAAGKATIRLHDALGRKIYENACDDCAEMQVHHLLPTGFYLITVETNNRVWTEKISVK